MKEPQRAPSAADEVRVLVADGDPNARAAIALLLAWELGFQVVSTVGNGESLLASARETRPDLVILDWCLPGPPTAHALEALRALFPSAQVVALSARAEHRSDATAAGVTAFVCKNEAPRQLVAVIRAVADRIAPPRESSVDVACAPIPEPAAGAPGDFPGHVTP